VTPKEEEGGLERDSDRWSWRRRQGGGRGTTLYVARQVGDAVYQLTRHVVTHNRVDMRKHMFAIHWAMRRQWCQTVFNVCGTWNHDHAASLPHVAREIDH
jgi:hypothetical protein